MLASRSLAGRGCHYLHNGEEHTQPAEKPAAGPIVFDNVTAASGISLPAEDLSHPLSILETTGCGAALIDADGDGLLDIVLLGKDYLSPYPNLGAFHFT